MRIRIFILSLLTGFSGMAQATDGSSSGLLAQAYELMGENPTQAIKVGHHLLKIADSENERADADLLIAESYLANGNSSQALQFGFRAKQEAEAVCSDVKCIRILLFLSGVLQDLQLDKQATQYGEMARSLSDQLSSSTVKNWTDTHLLLAQSRSSLDRQNPKKALDILQRIKSKISQLPDKEQHRLQSEIQIQKAKTFTALGQNDSAQYYFSKALALRAKNEPNNYLAFAELAKETAQLYFQQQQHRKAIGFLLEAAKASQKLQHPKLHRDLNKQLAMNYLAVNNQPNYRRHNQQFLVLSSQIENSENEATNTAFNLISKDQEKRFGAETRNFATLFYAVLACLVLILIFGLVQLLRNQSKQNRYQEIAKYLEMVKNRALVAVPVKREPSKNLVIPAETEHAILSKLKKFEGSMKFTQKEMSLAMLAAQVDTNTKYLSEIINKHYHDNFNTYINKLRINYIIEKMKTEPTYLHYKISYLAEESGFSSHSSFATVFKSITGIAPTSFIDFLKEEAANNKNNTA